MGLAAAPAARHGFGDTLWRLAAEGDVAALADAAELLGSGFEDADYDTSRARAFALAVRGDRDGALAELNEGWTAEWPTPPMYAADVARVRLLSGDPTGALDALDLAVRSAERSDPATAEIAAQCVARQRSLWRPALGVVARAKGAGRIGATARVLLAAAATRGS